MYFGGNPGPAAAGYAEHFDAAGWPGATVNDLKFNIERLLDQLDYQISDSLFYQSNVSSFTITINDVVALEWTPQSGQSFSSVKSGRLQLTPGDNRIKLSAQLRNGGEKTGYRIIYVFDEARCQPPGNGVHVTRLSFNGEAKEVAAGYQSVQLTRPWFDQETQQINFAHSVTGKHVALFVDTDRNMIFADDNDKTPLISSQNIDKTLNFDVYRNADQQYSAGPIYFRLIVDDVAQSSPCTQSETAQVIDFKVELKHGLDLRQVDFSYQQINEQHKFTAVSGQLSGLQYRWSVNGRVITTTTEKTVYLALSGTSSEVKLTLLQDGRVVAEEVKVVPVITSPELSINCVVEGTLCRFTVTHNQLSEPGRYVWRFGDGITDTRYNDSSFVHDYGQAGRYTAVLTLYLDDAQASFTSIKTVEITPSVMDFTIRARQVNLVHLLMLDGDFLAGDSFRWQLSDGTTTTTTQPQLRHIFTTLNQSHTVKVSVLRNNTVVGESELTFAGVADIQLAIRSDYDPAARTWRLTPAHQSAQRGIAFKWTVDGVAHQPTDSDGALQLNDVTPGEHQVTVLATYSESPKVTFSVTQSYELPADELPAVTVESLQVKYKVKIWQWWYDSSQWILNNGNQFRDTVATGNRNMKKLNVHYTTNLDDSDYALGHAIWVDTGDDGFDEGDKLSGGRYSTSEIRRIRSVC
ncbi:PKD domain-containing protein [Pseudoalteromonas viridis]|uniref:PKD domain-containing protein n=1 Tax=Pseudoalteromonas viridis TaxID=339617 RepID=A0ABX7V4V3_9GAMM|nr:PKD domain-containing protein [Pseudoalteromonas viridis]QTL35500.1 PKD domain-containing protein [Pseudoalteromonas viridis]